MKNQTAFKNTLLLFILILSSFYTLQAQNWNQMIKAIASDAASSDRFGFSVAISGNKAIVGAPQNDDNGTSSGSAYIFELNAGVWSETAKLNASDAATADQFGISVGISGNNAIIGAKGESGLTGAAYIFELNAGLWSETAKLTALDASQFANFGNSVSISGNKAIVGAYLKSEIGAGNVGAAYIFEKAGILWSQTAKLTPLDALAGDWFGGSVSITGNKAIVGADRKSDNGSESGAAYIFDLIGVTWSQTAKITASDAAAGDWFGHTVAISGNNVIIGAPQNDDIGFNSGSAYIFELAGASWVENIKITPLDAGSNDWFGVSVGISGNKALVGVRFDDDNGNNSGAAYVFEEVGPTWSEISKVTPLDANSNDEFGLPVAISGNYFIAGAQFNDDNGSNSGSAYIYEPCPLYTGIETVAACDSYLFNGITYTSNNNTALDTLTSIGGCDSIITLNLTINNSNTGIETVVACDSYVFNGITYTTNNNTAIDTLITVSGCDSLITLNLTIINSSTGIETASVCNNYVFNGITYTTSNNTALDTLINAVGCDSVITLNLTINNNTGTETASVCDSYAFNGITYTSDNNTALDTLTNTAGCDSVVTLNLTINNNTGIETASACGSYLFNGITYTSDNNTALDTLTNTAGCDSIITLNLTINNSSTGVETVSACNSYFFNGITYTNNNNTALDTLTNVGGCDSIVTLNLTINNSTTGTETASACNSYSFNGITYTSNNNTALDTLTNTAGCDSIVTLNLTINSINALIVNVSNDTLTIINQVGANYQWIDCSDSSIIAGETDPRYIATVNGDYAVIINIGSCTDTSACNNVNITSINNYQDLINNHKLYPNPTKSEVTITNFNSSITNLTIIDITGKVIDSYKPKTAIIDLSNYNKGIYFVRIQNGENTIIERIVKQ